MKPSKLGPSQRHKIGLMRGPDNVFFCRQHISQRAVRTALKKQLDPRRQNAPQAWSVPEF